MNDGSTLYYVDKTRQAMVSGFCVVGHCPEPIQTSGKRRGKTVEMYLINTDLHQALSAVTLLIMNNYLIFQVSNSLKSMMIVSFMNNVFSISLLSHYQIVLKQ